MSEDQLLWIYQIEGDKSCPNEKRYVLRWTGVEKHSIIILTADVVLSMPNLIGALERTLAWSVIARSGFEKSKIIVSRLGIALA